MDSGESWNVLELQVVIDNCNGTYKINLVGSPRPHHTLITLNQDRKGNHDLDRIIDYALMRGAKFIPASIKNPPP